MRAEAGSLLTFLLSPVYAPAVAAATGRASVSGRPHPRCPGRSPRSHSTLVRSIATFGNLLIPTGPNRSTAAENMLVLALALL